MKSIQHAQQAKALIQSVGKVMPIYLTRTPKGKRFLQMPLLFETTLAEMPLVEITKEEISATQQADGFYQPLNDPVI